MDYPFCDILFRGPVAFPRFPGRSALLLIVLRFGIGDLSLDNEVSLA